MEDDEGSPEAVEDKPSEIAVEKRPSDGYKSEGGVKIFKLGRTTV